MLNDKKTNYHLCMNIKGCLNNYTDKELNGMFTDDNGNPVSSNIAKNFLYDCLKKGWEVIPMGDCDNFDYKTGCKGHVQKEV